MKFSAPSYIFPASIYENALFLQSFVDDVGILFFEYEDSLNYTVQDLPKNLVDFGLSWHVHLPLILSWDKGALYVANQVFKLINKVSFLNPWAYVLHPPTSGDLLLEFFIEWERLGQNTNVILLENIVGNDLTNFEQCVERFYFGICFDIGHFLLDKQDKLLSKKWFWERLRLIHVCLTDKNGLHLPISKTPKVENLIAQILKTAKKELVWMSEVFEKESFLRTLQNLKMILEKYNG